MRLSLTLSLLLVLGAAASADPAYPAPSESGLVGKTGVTVVDMYDGTNDGSTEEDAFYLVVGGNGALTKQVRIKGRAGANEHMSALFHGGFLYVANARVGPSEAHCCPTHIDVQRFAMIDAGGTQTLTGGTFAVVPLPNYPSNATSSAVAAYNEEYQRRITTASYSTR